MLNYVAFLLTSMAIYGLMGLGLNLQWGFTGLINFGIAGFVAVGAYVTVILSLTKVPIVLAMLGGGFVAALFGLLMGFSTLRLREDYLAIVTIGSSELVRLVFNNEELYDNRPGSMGINGFPLPLESFRPNTFTRVGMVAIVTVIFGLALWKLWQWASRRLKSAAQRQKVGITAVAVLAGLLGLRAYVVTAISLSNFKANQAGNGLLFVALIVTAIAFWVVERLIRSPWGRVLKSIREDEEIAKALGKNVFAYKLQSLMIGGFLTGVGGALYAWQQSNVYPDNFRSDLTFNVWILMVLGGAGTNPGVLLGAVIFWVYTALTRDLNQILPFPTVQIDAFRMVFIGLLLIGLMVWRPQGILGNRDELTLGK
ncbi:branched-chain amino acid ABC transporter permease [Alkalinema sp. FACHB-956]|uniref:branched-chain amino acid ABC transporter permease n=1 Tax=Alkalinema sp. FACHB-956 TaxID=2692768 RepID=UPI001687C3EE|nr:branched-chain amino acid ABC transporter permease [Alkalinema sp. FACHB-956]